MSPTVDELRNEIRSGVGRFEREMSAGFTKEDLAAIAAAFGHEVGAGRLPPKAEMRAAIMRASGLEEGADPDDHGTAFRKDDLEALAAELADE